MLDGLGSDLAFSNGLKPSTGAGNVKAVRALWWDEFTRRPSSSGCPTTPTAGWPGTPRCAAYFKDNFVLVFRHSWHDSLYARKGTH